MTKHITLFSAGLLLAATLFATLGAAPVQVRQSRQQDDALLQSVDSGKFEYAVLSLLEDGQLQFHAGETNLQPRSFELRILYGRLGGKMRPSLPNLLNVIGNDRWDLVTYENGDWTFKRVKMETRK